MGSKQSSQSLKNDLDFLQSQTAQDEKTIKEQYRVFKQDCPAGKFNLFDFVGVYKELFPTEHGEEFCQHVFRAFDTDHDGLIDFKELILAKNLTNNGSAEERLKCAFSMYDVDGNGGIDQQEMTAVLRAMYKAYDTSDTTPTMSGTSVSLKEGVKSVFILLDENNDGQLTEEEFVSGCLQDDNMSKLLASTFLE